MVRRAGCRTEGTHFLNEEVFQFAGSQQGFGFLVEIGFVGRAAAFSNTEEFVLIAIYRVQVDLRRQVSAGVDLFVHVQRRVLRVAQVILDIGVIDAFRQRFFITATGPHALTFFTDDDRGAGILAGRQHAFGGDFGVS